MPKGQWEAGRALNFPVLTLYRKIIIPQAIPNIVPALGNYLVGIIKDSPLMSAFAVVEIMQRAKIIGSVTFRYCWGKRLRKIHSSSHPDDTWETRFRLHRSGR